MGLTGSSSCRGPLIRLREGVNEHRSRRKVQGLAAPFLQTEEGRGQAMRAIADGVFPCGAGSGRYQLLVRVTGQQINPADAVSARPVIQDKVEVSPLFFRTGPIEPPLHGCCSVCVPLGVKRAATYRSKSSPLSLDGCCSAGDKVPDYQKRLEVNQEQEVVARINNASPSAASDARAEQVLPLLLVAVAADTAEAAASCGDQEEANLAGGGAARLPITRRAHAASLLLGLVGVDVAVAAPAPARADDESGGGEEGVLGAIKSIFDPNEKTKAGKVLPKAYLKAAREVVRTLRESLEEDDGGDMAKFRRNADAAKESIREFLGGWRGQQAVAAEESYVALEKAIRSLAEFYSKAGPSAPLPQDVKNKILDDLSTADAYL
ncbi:uncharacterized protein LOC101773480 isoform X2 [Setaria italica]|uniref:uncharacterized protein LOC101773480 isoform X2 n=1 Tax=Setaria italica TaxID=4555 RepID=UPI000350990F|nr:uncharacterized protein LOC101773480 isoform X2 [Setaria italica]